MNILYQLESCEDLFHAFIYNTIYYWPLKSGLFVTQLSAIFLKVEMEQDHFPRFTTEGLLLHSLKNDCFLWIESFHMSLNFHLSSAHLNQTETIVLSATSYPFMNWYNTRIFANKIYSACTILLSGIVFWVTPPLFLKFASHGSTYYAPSFWFSFPLAASA